MKSEFVSVPFYVEPDGRKTHFLPKCKEKGGYRIGAKGNEARIPDYWEALSLVTAMNPPRFRRANPQGNFGLIVCRLEDVEEVRRDFIDAELAAQAG